MQKLFSIQLSHRKRKEVIDFGIVKTKEEIAEIFGQRFRVYDKYGYIDPEYFAQKEEYDAYDRRGQCIYFVARWRNALLGSARVVTGRALPVQKDCFSFKVPAKMLEIPWQKRGEISRLVVERTAKTRFVPRHLIMAGILYAIVRFAKRDGFEGGYAFIKLKLQKKIERLRMPFRRIRPYALKYDQKRLRKYFLSSSDPVLPIYFLRNDFEKYFSDLFRKSGFFTSIEPDFVEWRGTFNALARRVLHFGRR